MPERDPCAMATVAVEAMHFLLEFEHQQGELNLDAMMKRLKDLSAYSLAHADILERREGVELLALARFFGMSSAPEVHPNQARLALLSQPTIEYQGQAETIKQEIAAREARCPQAKGDEIATWPNTNTLVTSRHNESSNLVLHIILRKGPTGKPVQDHLSYRHSSSFRV